MYEPTRIGGFCTWEEVQLARVKAVKAFTEFAGGTVSQRRKALADAALISLLSLIPPDRVGIIRRLRFGHTLKKREGGGWRMDLTSRRDGHKTSRFYGEHSVALLRIIPTSTPSTSWASFLLRICFGLLRCVCCEQCKHRKKDAPSVAV